MQLLWNEITQTEIIGRNTMDPFPKWFIKSQLIYSCDLEEIQSGYTFARISTAQPYYSKAYSYMIFIIMSETVSELEPGRLVMTVTRRATHTHTDTHTRTGTRTRARAHARTHTHTRTHTQTTARTHFIFKYSEDENDLIVWYVYVMSKYNFPCNLFGL